MKLGIGFYFERKKDLDNNLKNYRDKELKMYALANIFVLLYLERVITLEELVGNKNEYMALIVTILNSTLFLAIFYIFVLLSDSLVSTNLKNKFVYFWRPLPGQVVFSKMKKNVKDERFLQQQVLERYNDIYENMPHNKQEKRKYENSKWYTIYNKHRGSEMISESNRDYLLCRDMTNSTIIIFILYVTFSLVLGLVSYKVECIVYLLIMYAVTNIATRTRGERFVNNVIALDLQER